MMNKNIWLVLVSLVFSNVVCLDKPHPSVKTIENYFKTASEQYGVPMELLMIIGQVESNWVQIGPSIDRGWGIMHLVENDYCNTLTEASQLLGLDKQTLKDNPKYNILGAAALLAHYAGEEQKNYASLEDWFKPVKKFTGLISEDLREMQAKRYFDQLKEGVTSKTLWDETIIIDPVENQIDQRINAGNKFVDPSLSKSSEYEYAISDLTSCNYTVGRNYSIDTWVNHWIGTGTYAGAISWFHNCSAEASAHFVIRSSDGQITQTVSVYDTAWHCGAYGYPYNNSRSIGVEHEATIANPDLWYSFYMLNESARMSRYFCDIFYIPMTRSLPGIRGHNDMPGTSTSCPGSLPWERWMHFLTLSTNTPEVNANDVAMPVSFDWYSDGGSSPQYRIQVSTSESGWTKEDGFTSSTDESSTIRVNQNTAGNTNYIWTNTSPYPPQPNTTYYWTVRLFVDGTSSYYLKPRAFTTGESTSEYPDMVIMDMWTAPSNPVVGEEVDLYVKIKNVGDATATPISLDYKINNTTVGSDSSSSLAPGADQTTHFPGYVFSNAGTYDYCVYIDEVENEQNTLNNSYCINVNVEEAGGDEDIYLTDVSVTPATIYSGGEVTANATMNYSGNQPDSALPDFTLAYYLSSDCSFSDNDIYLSNAIVGLGSDNPSHTVNETLTIPVNTSNGAYYILCVADADAGLNESDENNNMACAPITIENVTSAIDDGFSKQLVLYPNPTSGVINIKAESSVIIRKVLIYDLNGRQLKVVEGNHLNRVDMSELSSGVYVLKVISQQHQTAVFRIMKQ